MPHDLNKRAKEIVERILYITIATASKKGHPWNSPVYSAFDELYNFYWASDQNGQHSKNIAENPHVFLVIYDSTVPEGTGEGVYVKATAKMLTDETDIRNGLKYLDRRVGKKKDSASRPLGFMGKKSRRVYKATPEQFWMNDDGEVNGVYIDIRTEVNLLERST